MTPTPRSLPSRAAAALAVATALAAAAACTVNVNTTTAEARETTRFTVAGAPRVTLDTFDGSIEVHSWDKREVEVEIEKRAQDDAALQRITVEATQDGDAVTVRVRGPERPGSEGVTVGISQSPTARLRVALPKDSQLELVTGDGSIRIEDVDGAITARSGDGSIQGMRLAGALRLRTGDGTIRLQRASGTVEAETEDGSVTIDGQVKTVNASSGDGSVRVTVEEGAVLAGAWAISTRDGSITLRLPRQVDAAIEASTGDGSIQSSHPQITIEGDGGRRRDVRVTVGSGATTMTLKTGDGSIRIE
jgi:DUF4097 and DUF4098 domain-containing protein YvlB